METDTEGPLRQLKKSSMEIYDVMEYACDFEIAQNSHHSVCLFFQLEKSITCQNSEMAHFFCSAILRQRKITCIIHHVTNQRLCELSQSTFRSLKLDQHAKIIGHNIRKRKTFETAKLLYWQQTGKQFLPRREFKHAKSSSQYITPSMFYLSGYLRDNE